MEISLVCICSLDNEIKKLLAEFLKGNLTVRQNRRPGVKEASLSWV
jgi:hypothetical protein